MKQSPFFPSVGEKDCIEEIFDHGSNDGYGYDVIHVADLTIVPSWTSISSPLTSVRGWVLSMVTYIASI